MKQKPLSDDPSEVSEIGTRLPDPVQRPTTTVVPKERIFERKQGCWNCTSFDNGALAEKHFQEQLARDKGTVLERRLSVGCDFETAAAAAEEVAQRVDRLGFKPPAYGLCMAGRSQATFVSAKFLCDRWNGRVGVEGRYDAVPGELYDKLGEKGAP